MDVSEFWKNEFVDAARFAFGLRLLLALIPLGIGLFYVLGTNADVDLLNFGQLYLCIIGILLPAAIYFYSGYRAVSKFKFSPLKGALAVLAGALFYSSITSWIWGGNTLDTLGYVVVLAGEGLAGAIFGFVGALAGAYIRKRK